MKRDRESGSPVTASISEADAKLYDRQIRLWGAASQQKIFEGRVLAIGVCGVMAETLKNLALAGVGRLEVVDDGIVSVNDVGSNLLFGRESVGLNRALACRERLQELNPRVEVVVTARSASSLDEGFVSTFDVIVCSSTRGHADALHVNVLARRGGGTSKVFFTVASHGRYGFVVCDASKHVYRLEGSDVDVHCDVMPSFEEVCRSKPLVGKKSTPHLVWTQLLLRFQLAHGRLPVSSDVALLSAMQKEMQVSTPVSEAELENFARFASTELSPVCAVLGGIAGQQVLRALTRMGKPMNNIFVFDSKTQIVGKIDFLQ